MLPFLCRRVRVPIFEGRPSTHSARSFPVASFVVAALAGLALVHSKAY
jgi:hypothetical protein